MTKLLSSDFEKVEDVNKFKFQDLFVCFSHDGEIYNIPLKEVYYKKSKSKPHVKSSLEVAKLSKSKTQLFVQVEGKEIELEKDKDNQYKFNFSYKKLELPKTFTTISKTQQTYGLSATYKVNECQLSNMPNAYLYAKVSGQPNYTMLKKSEIYCIEDGKTYTINDLQKQNKDLTERIWYCHGKTVEELYIGKEFRVATLKKDGKDVNALVEYQKFNKETLTVETWQKEDDQEKLLYSQEKEGYFSVYTPKALPNANNPKNVDHMFEVQNFELVDGSQQLSFAVDGKPVTTNVGDLYIRKPVTKEFLKSNIANNSYARKFVVKIDDKFVYCKLTLEQMKSLLNDKTITIQGKKYSYKDFYTEKFEKVDATKIQLNHTYYLNVNNKMKQVVISKEQYNQLNNYDGYIKVSLKGENKDVMVRISDLKMLNGEAITPSTITSSCLGTSLKVTIDDKEYETEPLTVVQANMRYRTIKTFEESNELLPTDDTYLKLKDGRFVKEKEAFQPISYKFCTAKNCDAFMFTIKEGTKDKTIIISKSYFEKTKSDNLIVAGQNVNLKDAKPLKQVDHYSSDCNVVQTTSTGEIAEACKVVKDKEGASQLSEEELVKLRKELLGMYASKKYIINSTFDEKGNKLELDSQGKRYEFTDKHLIKDVAEDSNDYKALNCKPIRFEEKNGKFKVAGRPKYKVGKGILEGYKNYFKVMGITLAVGCSVGGLIAAAALATLSAATGGIVAGVFFGAMLAPIPGIPLFCGIKGLIKNHNLKFKNKVEVAKKHIKKESKATLKNLDNDLTKALNQKDLKTEDYERIERNYLLRCSIVKQDIVATAGSQLNVDFKIDNKIGNINSNNCSFAFDCIKELNDNVKEAKKLKKYADKYNTLNEQITKYNSKGKTKKANKLLAEQQKYQTRASRYNALTATITEQTQNFVAGNPQNVKDCDFAKSLDVVEKTEKWGLFKIHALKDDKLLTPEQKEIVKDLTFDAANNVFMYKGKVYKADTKTEHNYMGVITGVKDSLKSKKQQNNQDIIWAIKDIFDGTLVEPTQNTVLTYSKDRMIGRNAEFVLPKEKAKDLTTLKTINIDKENKKEEEKTV